MGDKQELGGGGGEGGERAQGRNEIRTWRNRENLGFTGAKIAGEIRWEMRCQAGAGFLRLCQLR